LSPRDRAAVLLVDAQGFDYESAAKVLDVPAGTVASRLNRARAILRRFLDDHAQGASRR
jgi:RNA polymerase sigma-70 factor (ECF subfamily)